jgi:Flp pilus assembly protein TadB
MRSQLRMIVFGVVIAVIVVGWIVESPGTVEGVGLAVVLLTMLLLILRERRNTR